MALSAIVERPLIGVEAQRIFSTFATTPPPTT